jgi:uncharacterized membrane protein YkvI
MEDSTSNAFKLAFIFLGTVLGAAFCTGQEALQFFNKKNATFFAILFAAFLLGFNCYMVLKKINDDSITSFDEYVTRVATKVIGRIFGAVLLFSSFVVFFGMYSAAGSIFQDSFGLSKSTGILTLAAACFVVLAADIKGVLVVNAILTPLKIIGIPILAVIAIKSGNYYLLNNSSYVQNLFVPSNLNLFWGSILSAASYVCLNCTENAAVMVPYKDLLSDESVRWGSIFSGLFVGILLTIVWLAFKLNYGVVEGSTIPMLALVRPMSHGLRVLYQVLICAGTFTTAAAMGLALTTQVKNRGLFMRIFISFVLCVIAIPLAFMNFGDIVNKLFRWVGYVGILWMAVITFDFFRHLGKK